MTDKANETSIDPGAKHDVGKAPVHSVLRYFPRAIEQVARVSEHGAKLHGWDTWQTIDNPHERYADADIRHEIEICKGNEIDDGPKGSGLLHLAHKAWNALARLELALRDEK